MSQQCAAGSSDGSCSRCGRGSRGDVTLLLSGSRRYQSAVRSGAVLSVSCEPPRGPATRALQTVSSVFSDMVFPDAAAVGDPWSFKQNPAHTQVNVSPLLTPPFFYLNLKYLYQIILHITFQMVGSSVVYNLRGHKTYRK